MSKKINFILININAYASYEGRDMAGTMRVKNLFNSLMKKKEITVSNLIILDLLCMEYNGHTESSLPNIDCLSIGYQSIKNPVSVIKFINRGMNFIKAHYQKDADNIIYNYEYPDIRNFLLLLYAKFKGYKIVFDLVEDKKHDIVKSWNDKVRTNFSLAFLKMIPYYADAVFVISSHLMNEITKITKNKIPVFSLPISVNFENIDNNQPKTNLQNNVTEIFYGGTFGTKDGLEYLLEAIDILDKKNYKFKLVLCGKGQPQDMERIFGKIKNKELVDYKGFLSTEDYFKLLCSVDICCMTRNNSVYANAGFPFKLGEFLAAGKVVVASRIGDVEKYLVHKESAYLVTPENVQELAESIMYCIDNLESLTKTMGVKGRLVAETHFNSKVSSEFLLDKCNSLFQK